METVILILGEKTQEIKEILDVHYRDSIKVTDSFNTPTEFFNTLNNKYARVDRIIVHEESFISHPVVELTNLRKMLESYFVKYSNCVILTGPDEDIAESVKFITEDFDKKETIEVYSHERYNHDLVLGYVLRKVSRKHFQSEKTEYDDIYRMRVDSKDTFKLEEKEIEPDKLVIVDRDSIASRDLQDKLKALTSLSETVKSEQWTDNPIIRNLNNLSSLAKEFPEVKKYELDYTIFKSHKEIRTEKDNTCIITGELRSGKTCTAYALAKSGALKKKILVIDLDVRNLGLSYLSESYSDRSTVFLMQDFKNRFKDCIYTLSTTQTNLNVIACNTKTLLELGDIDLPSMISLIIASGSKYFDKVIFDIPIDVLPDYVSLLKRCEKLLVTTPTSITQLTSLIRSLMSSEIRDDIFDKDIVVVPCNVFKEVAGISSLKRSQIRTLLSETLPKKVSVLPELQFVSFNRLDDSLFHSVNGIKEGEIV